MNLLPTTLQALQQELEATSQPDTARRILAEYFSFFSLTGIHHELWVLTGATLSNDTISPYNKPEARSDLIFFFEFTKLMMEAACLLFSPVVHHTDGSPQ